MKGYASIFIVFCGYNFHPHSASWNLSDKEYFYQKQERITAVNNTCAEYFDKLLEKIKKERKKTENVY